MQDLSDIRNWRRLDARLTTSGQPTERQLAAIKALGVTHMVNLGLHSHPDALPDEASSVAALGMNYRHMPVDFAHPTQADLAAFYELMKTLEPHVLHVHCIANFRVSAFIYRFRMDVLGWNEADARPDLDAIWTPQGAWAQLVAQRDA
jgi:protein tyrosine phosphatase (PTP) superfamily phosphohydrolase (DUF442 family)